MKKTMLLAVLMMLGLAAGAFAQATFQGATENVTLVVDSGHTELTGDVLLSVVAVGPTTASSLAGQITLKYSVPFTNPLDGSKGTPVLTGTGGFANPLTTFIDEAASNGPAGNLVITIPTGAAIGDTIRVHGVRLDVAAFPTKAFTVTLSVTKNFIQNGQFSAPVIDGAAPGIKLSTSDDDTHSHSLTVNGIHPAGGNAQIVLNEGFNNAFGLAVDPTATGSQMILIRLAAAPPEGVTVAFPLNVYTDVGGGTAAWRLSKSDGTNSAGVTIDFESAGSDLDVFYRLVSNNNPVLMENINIYPITVKVADDTPLPIAPGTITFSATLAPNDPAFDKDNEVTDLPIPRYQPVFLTGDLLVFQGNTTALMLPLAQWMSPIDTGIAIANTSKDPGKAALGASAAAIPQTGPITFYMWNQQVGATAPVLITYTTGPDSPGSGLDPEGNLPAGSLYTVNLSQLLEAKGVTGDFQGYIIIVCPFTNAHGQNVSYIMTATQNFSWGAPMNVIGRDRTIVPETLGQ